MGKHVNSAIEVKVFGNTEEDMEQAIKVLKNKVNKSGIMRAVKNNRFHMKPSEVKAIKKKAARKREMIRQRKANQRRFRPRRNPRPTERK